MIRYIWFGIVTLLLMACGGGDGSGEEPFVSKDYINVAPNLQLLGDGQETELKITANCSWKISNPASWLTVTPSSGTNNETVRVSAGKNSTGEDRTAILTIQGGNAPTRSVVVSQSKGSEDPIVKTLSTNLSSLSFEAKEGSKTFTISSNTNWTISKPDWCTLSSSSGNGNADIVVTASDNPSKEQRSGQIVISGEGLSSVTISVSQKGKDISLSVNVSSLSFESKEESKSFSISSNTNWFISKPDWCTLSASSGNGNSDIVVTVFENPNKEQRSGQIIISGEGVDPMSINVSQKGKDTTNSEEPGAEDNLPPS